MPRVAQKNKKIRLNLDLCTEGKQRLVQLRELSQADSLSEVVRRSLSLYGAVTRHIQNGGSIILQKEGEPDQKLLIL